MFVFGRNGTPFCVPACLYYAPPLCKTQAVRRLIIALLWFKHSMTLTLHLEKCPVNASVKASKQSARTSILIQDLPPYCYLQKQNTTYLGGVHVSQGIISGADEKT